MQRVIRKSQAYKEYLVDKMMSKERHVDKMKANRQQMIDQKKQMNSKLQ